MTAHAHSHDDSSIAEILDLDAVVMQGYFAEAMEWVREGASHSGATGPVARILDVGAGTGAGTVALAAQFADAQIVAADISHEMLERVAARAVSEGIDDRVSTVQLDLTAVLPELGLFDLVWSSAALHEVPDAESVLAKLLGVLKPGGLIVVVEMDAPPRFLTDDSSRESGGALESRIHELLDEKRSPAHDHPDWSDGLERTGFIDGKKVSFTVDSSLEADALGGRYAQSYWRRLQHFVSPRLSDPERVLFDVLLADEGPLSLRRRGDLRLRAGRTAWAARRP